MTADSQRPSGDPVDGGGRSVGVPAGAGRYLLALLLVIVVLAWQAGVFTPRIRAGETEPPRAAAAAGETTVVTAWRGPRTRRLVGAVVARERVELAPEIAGRIEAIDVVAGQRVAAGATLAVLDGRVARSQLARAEAVLARARAEARGADRLLASVRQAAAARSVPRTELIDAERTREAAARAVEEAQAALEGARARLDFTRLSSPIDGVVVDTLADPGDLASPERPIILLHRPEALEVAVNVPAALAPQLAPGARLALRLPDQDDALEGTVRTLTAAADPATRTVLARVTAPLPPEAVAGTYVDARLSEPLEAREPVSVRVPAQALERVRQLTFVHVLGEDGRAVRRLVRLGEIVGDDVLVLAGLRPGERILTRPPAASEAGET